MFTGLVQELGTIEEVSRGAGGVRLTVSARLARDLREGDSVDSGVAVRRATLALCLGAA